jgi:hypothetical protein
MVVTSDQKPSLTAVKLLGFMIGASSIFWLGVLFLPGHNDESSSSDQEAVDKALSLLSSVFIEMIVIVSVILICARGVSSIFDAFTLKICCFPQTKQEGIR